MAIEPIITRQMCKGARAMLDWSRAELAGKAGISERTLIDFERGERKPFTNNLKAIRTALEEAGINFTEDGCVCLHQKKEKKTKAKPKTSKKRSK